MKGMRTAVASAVAAAAALTAGLAVGAGGGPSPGVVQGWEGVLSPEGTVRYVALGAPRWTMVAAIRARGGRVVRTRTLRGIYGIPAVAYDGSTGGVSADGRTLVLSSFPPPYGGTTQTTRFAFLATRTFKLRGVVRLPGSWSYDALSPDASTLFLVEYLSAGQNPRYRVRAYDLEAKRLYPGAIVDRLEGEAEMRGSPVTRATSRNGRWAYTLYGRSARARDAWFVHALDTVRRQAFCIDLPIRLRSGTPVELLLRLSADGRTLTVRNGRATVAVVDTKTFEVRRS